MQVNQISQANVIQQISNIGNSTSTISDSKASDSSSAFANMLEEILKNTASNSSKDLSGESSVDTSSKDSVSGLNSLTVDPQKLLNMMLSIQNTDSSTTAAFANDSSTSATTDQMTQMLNSLFQTAMQNQESTTKDDKAKDSIITSSQAI